MRHNLTFSSGLDRYKVCVDILKQSAMISDLSVSFLWRHSHILGLSQFGVFLGVLGIWLAFRARGY